MSYFSKIFQQTFWQILGKVITALSTFIILGLVARNYGTAGTGIFTLALAYLAIFYMLSDFGFNAHVLRKGTVNRVQAFGSEAQARRGIDEWHKLLGVRLVWSGVLSVLAVGLLPFLPFATADFNRSVFFGSLAIIGSGIFVTCNLIFQSKLRYDLSVLASSFGTLVSLAVFIFLVTEKIPVPFLLFGHLIGWVVIALGALILIRKFLLNIMPVFKTRYAINLFKESWPIAATLSLNVIYFRADAFLIAYFKSSSDVGIYNVAYAVFQSALVLPTFIMNAYYPLMLKSLAKVKLVAVGLLGLSFFGSVITIFLSPIIIKILTGGGFVGSVTSLQILSLGFPAYFLSSLLMWVLITRGKYKSMFLIYTSGLILNLVLNFIFIPQYSFFAASWTTVISEYLILLLQILILTR